MTGEWIAARSSRAVIIAVIVAAIAVTAFSVVGIAVLMGWIPKDRAASPTSLAPPGPQGTGNAPIDLTPGETLVDPIPAKRAEPLMPRYSQPAVPPPAPAREAAPREAAPVREAAPTRVAVPAPPARQAPPAESPPRRREAAAPQPPAYARAGPPPPAREFPAPSRRGSCVDCGTVSTITTYPGRWEVRVRFEDGELRTFRYRTRPPFGVGERVRLEDDLLVHE